MHIIVSKFQFYIIWVLYFSPILFGAEENNSSTHVIDLSPKIIRVVEPGIFDFKYADYQIRTRVWGVIFPKRGQPGFQEAISFAEQNLFSTEVLLDVKIPFDTRNLKVVDIKLKNTGQSFSNLSIMEGIGWHDEKETGRYGQFLISQLKAKRNDIGIWGYDYDFNQNNKSYITTPEPLFKNMISERQKMVPSLSYWVTSLGKIHRPDCAFYQRGRGKLTMNPSGTDCRICGGRKSKD